MCIRDSYNPDPILPGKSTTSSRIIYLYFLDSGFVYNISVPRTRIVFSNTPVVVFCNLVFTLFRIFVFQNSASSYLITIIACSIQLDISSCYIIISYSSESYLYFEKSRLVFGILNYPVKN